VRRAYTLMIVITVLMGSAAFGFSQALDIPLRDPDGFLGPAWTRAPLLILGAFVVDIVPRTLWRTRGNVKEFGGEAKLLVREHWTRERIQLVVLGVSCFYITYVSYRNLKNFLPLLRPNDARVFGDYELHRFDQWLFFGNDAAVVLHDILGTGVTAQVLSWIYLIFLPIVPISVTIWVVWSRNVSFGYWFVTSQCLVWTLGTISYYMIPTLGPNFQFPWLYSELETTEVSGLLEGLYYGRIDVRTGVSDGVQSIAGFASLHVGVTLLIALIAQYTVRHRIIKIICWTFMGLTVLATTYFGWHYIADDIFGALIAFVSFYLGGLATGQKFDEHGRHTHPTTTTGKVPLDA
jgi:hypothetical protein